MKQNLIIAAVISLCAAGMGRIAALEPAPIPQEERLNWTRHLVPLPKKIAMTSKAIVPAREIRIVAADDSQPLVRQAVVELREALDTGGAAAPEAASFRLALQVGGQEAAELSTLPNADQAYVIRPAAQHDGLLLAGGGPRGVYYAAKTMQQFLKAKAAGGQAQIPLVSITDWPDMQDRGLWGSGSSKYLRWMSDRKMNHDEQASTTGVDKAKRCYVDYPPYKQKLIDEGPTYGINPVPVVVHLEQLSGMGIFDAYPELKGKGGRPGTICYTNSLFVDILSQWLLLWRSKPGVKEVDVWMAENLDGGKGCQCERCIKEDRSILEARAIVAAWKKAREKESDLGLRVLTSEETEKSNPRVFAELPPTIKIWYYHSLFTYNASHTLIIRPYLVDTAKSGRWLGVCWNMCAVVGFAKPFTGAEFIHSRINAFVDKGFSGMLGCASPDLSHVWFNTEAAAEWAWNAKGRSPHEFALSWAVRRGLKDPEKFAEWSDANGAVAWDVHGSEWPSGELRGVPGKVAGLLRQGKLPDLGYALWGIYRVPWGDIMSVEQLDRDVAKAERAVQLAREMGEPVFLHESLMVQGYISSLKALWQLKQVVRPGGVADADKATARRSFKMYLDALEQAKVALPAWEDSLPGAAGEDRVTRETAQTIDAMIVEMKAVAVELGCEPR